MIEFFSNLPDDWEQTTLGDVCKQGGGDIQTGPFGSQLHAADYVPSGIPSIMPQNIGDNRILENGIARITEADAIRLSRYRVRVGDIVYSRRGDVERRALVRSREDGWLCGTGCLRVRFGDSEINPSYAAHYLGHPSVREWIVRHAHGATMPNLNTSILSALPFVAPPRVVQDKIAQTLDAFDDRIELNRRLSETLEAIAQALFQSWFVDFDPVRAKANGEAPGAICQRLGLTPDLLALFPEEFEDIAGIQTPAGWSFASAEEVSEVGIGKTPPRKESEWFSDNPEHVRWLSIRDMGLSDAFARRSSETLTPEAIGRFNIRKVPDYTVLLSFKLTIGRLAITDGEMVTNEAIAHFNLNKETRVTTEYLYFYLKNFDFDSLGSTSSIAEAVNSRMIRKLPILVPPADLIDAFSMQARGLLMSIKEIGRQSDTLIETRDTLLPRLLSGEIAVLLAEAP